MINNRIEEINFALKKAITDFYFPLKDICEVEDCQQRDKFNIDYIDFDNKNKHEFFNLIEDNIRFDSTKDEIRNIETKIGIKIDDLKMSSIINTYVSNITFNFLKKIEQEGIKNTENFSLFYKIKKFFNKKYTKTIKIKSLNSLLYFFDSTFTNIENSEKSYKYIIVSPSVGHFISNNLKSFVYNQDNTKSFQKGFLNNIGMISGNNIHIYIDSSLKRNHNKVIFGIFNNNFNRPKFGYGKFLSDNISFPNGNISFITRFKYKIATTSNNYKNIRIKNIKLKI